MKLFYTPRSHFARKVRILAAALDVDLDLVDVGNVGDSEDFADNPLMAVPAVVDGDRSIIDSDHIASYIAGDDDAFKVRTRDAQHLNARAVMNGVMSAEVEVLLARRSGIDVDKYARFEKKRETIRHGLGWLEERAAIFDGPPHYAHFHLVAMWDHIMLHHETLQVDLDHPALRANTGRTNALDFVVQSRPT